MIHKIRKIQYRNQFTYYPQFGDREENVDFKSLLWGEAFEKLKDQEYFKKASLDKSAGTISWPNGIDIAPESLYKKIADAS